MAEEQMQQVSESVKIEKLNSGVINFLANVIEARDYGSGEHVKRVQKISRRVAEHVMADYPEYGLTEDHIKLIEATSALHDIGKISIPDKILLKPGPLTDEEKQVMKTHSEKGCELLDLMPDSLDNEYMDYCRQICHYHHEKYDGSGYPEGISGEDIPIAAQIVSVADCFDALTSNRPYKEAYPKDVAIKMICEGQCGQFSDKILKSFLKAVEGLV